MGLLCIAGNIFVPLMHGKGMSRRPSFVLKEREHVLTRPGTHCGEIERLYR